MERHCEEVIEQLVTDCPDKVIERLVTDCSDRVIEQLVTDCPDKVIEKIFEECSESVKKIVVDSQLQDINTEESISKLTDIFIDNSKLFERILRMINESKPYLLEKALENDFQLARTIGMLCGASDKILFGGVGKAEYFINTKKLEVSGFFLPLEVYDAVEILHKQKCLGRAQLNIKRPDVYKKYPNYHNLYSGWKFEAEVDCLTEGDTVEVLLKRNNCILKKIIKEVNFVYGKENEIGKYYKIEMPSLLEYNESVYERVRKFNEACKYLERWFDWRNVEFYKKYTYLQSEILYGTRKVEEILLSIFCEEKEKIINFIDARMEYQDISRLWTIINELLIEEEYYFETDKLTPVIIDCGANIGLAVYYFKSRFPQCRILAFEPSRDAYAILKRNVERNGWNNVDVLPYALDDEEGTQTLYVPIEDCLGASLTKRPFEYNDEQKVRIEYINTKKLNDYIDAKIDFLKLDVEGVETRIIRGLGNKLKFVEHIFLEYHYGNMVEDNDFLELLGMLERQGIYYQVAKSPGFTISTSHRTMNYVGEKYSLNIWGKQL